MLVCVWGSGICNVHGCVCARVCWAGVGVCTRTAVVVRGSCMHVRYVCTRHQLLCTAGAQERVYADVRQGCSHQ